MNPFETGVDDDYLTIISDYLADYREHEYDEGRVFDEEMDEEEEEEEEEKEEKEMDIFADLVAQFHKQRAEIAESKKEHLRQLIGMKNEGDESRETLITPEEEFSVVTGRPSTESSIHPCLKDIDISDSELKLQNLYTMYRIPDDPGLVPAFWSIHEHQAIIHGDDGSRFYDLVKSSGVQPIRTIKDMLQTKAINLQYYGLNSRTLKPLCDVLMTNSTVETINLMGNWLSEDACYHLNELLIKNGIITTVILSGCRIGRNGAAKLYDGISRNVSLSTLDLSDCNIRNEGFEYIAEAMCNTDSVSHLSLSGNHLDESCSDALEKLFSSAETLRRLNLSWNSLYTGETWKKLCRGLETNETLSDLDLSWNALGQECVTHLRRLLLRSIALKSLNLSGNRFYDETVVPISRGLSKNTALEELYMADNPLKGDGVLTLLKALTPEKAPDSSLRLLDLTNVWANKSVLPELEIIENEKPWLRIKLGGIFSNFIIEGPDVQNILLKRANYEAMRPTNKRRRKNFGHFVLSLADDTISKTRFTTLLKNFGIKLSQSLINEIVHAFAGTRKNTINQELFKTIYMKHYPHTKLSSEKPVKKKNMGKNPLAKKTKK